MADQGFVVFDVETTGLNPRRHDRIIEIGLIRLDSRGNEIGRWQTLLNPGRDLGPTHIHGIRGADVKNAPQFADISDELKDLIDGCVLVAHNARFDTDFVVEEWRRAGLLRNADYRLPYLCTMQMASQLIPGAGRTLSDCCAAFDISNARAHSALGDTEATAELFRSYLGLDGARRLADQAAAGKSFQAFEIATVGHGSPTAPRLVDESHKGSDGAVAMERIVAELPAIEGISDDERNYLALLDRHLEDGVLTAGETAELGDAASVLGLRRRDRRELEERYFAQVVETVWLDGRLSHSEEVQLRKVAEALSLGDKPIDEALTRTADAFPASSSASGAFSVLAEGDMVVLTGEMEVGRDEWIRRLTTVGFVVHPAVTKKVKAVIAEDKDSLSGKATKARQYGIPIVSELEMDRYLSQLQESPTAVGGTNGGTALTNADPADAETAASAQSREKVSDVVNRFATKLPASRQGLGWEILYAGSVKLVVFYHKDINFALVHNRVGVLAGIGAIAEPEPESESGGRAERVIDVKSLHIGMRSDRFDGGRGWTAYGFTLAPGKHHWIEPRGINWDLDTSAFLDVDEAVAETLEIAADINGETVNRSIDIRVLAHDQWSPRSLPETIAAFVRPRSRAIGRILSAASDLLEERTGNSSLAGYQLGEIRVRQTAEAIFDAICGFGIRYSMPPASFEIDGQKVRTADEILDTRFGTCLDLAVMHAAALEEAGMQAYLVLLPGHAMAAFSVRELNTESSITERGQIRNLFGSEYFFPIETTEVTGTDHGDFAGAMETGFDKCRAGETVTGIVNVDAAHRRILPLPAVVDEGGVRTIVHVESRPLVQSPKFNASDLTLSVAESGSHLDIGLGAKPRRVEKWQTDLLDLSLRNPLLKLSNARGVTFLLPPSQLASLEDQLAQNTRIELTPDNNVEDIDRIQGIESAASYSDEKLARLFAEEGRVFVRSARGRAFSKLTTLRRDARSIREETGANSLYLSIGLMRWTLKSGGSKKQEANSPLFLLPIEISGSASRPYSIRIEPNSDLQPNFCLIEKLHQEYGLEIPQLEKPPADDNGIDVDRVFTELRQFFVSRGLPFSIEAEARLAIIKFSSLDMWRDVGLNWQDLTSNDLVNHLVFSAGELLETPNPVEDVVPGDEANTFLPMPADGSQLAAIRAATDGASFVLEGPPGTGKSQTITNMIADGLAHGRSVLFVAEKQAALSVVVDRLHSVGLGPLVLNAHGPDQTVNSVRAQLKAAIRTQMQGNPAAFGSLREKLARIIAELQEYPVSVHGPSSTGDSVWTAYQRCASLEQQYPSGSEWRPEEIPLTQSLINLSNTELNAFAREVETAAKHAHGLPVAHQWSMVGPSFGDESVDAVSVLLDHVGRLIQSFVQLPQSLRGLLDRCSEVQVTRLRAWIEDLADPWSVIPSWLHREQPTPDDIRARREIVDRFGVQWGQFESILSPAATTVNVESLQAEWDAAQVAGFLQRKKLTRLVLDKIRAQVVPAATAGVSENPARFLNELRAYRQAERDARTRSGFADRPQLRLTSPEVRANIQGEEEKAHNFASHSAVLTELLRSVPDARPQLEQLGVQFHQDPRLSAIMQEFEESWRQFISYAGSTPQSIDRWLAGRSRITGISESIPEWRTAVNQPQSRTTLGRTLRLQSVMTTLNEMGLSPIAELLRQGRPGEVLFEAMELAVSRHRLNQLLQERDLDVFSYTAHQHKVAEYVQTSQKLRELTSTELPAQLIGNRSDFKPSVGLLKELDRKRGGSVRSLFEKFGTEVLQLTPVVLMSPSTVARSLPTRSDRFDTVIFDEASQVKVSDAIGALGRAASSVIVGDSKQMPPTSAFSAAIADPTDVEPDADKADAGFALAAAVDQESILNETANSGLVRRSLNWHYRSKHDSLISFSNRKYYEGNLQIFPAPPGDADGLGVSVRFVGGTFDSGGTRTNHEEASAIVRDIEERIASDPRESIGVVTFNTQQRDLILDLLEKSGDKAVRDSLERPDEPVFVKNLESVQGDERDIILFSIAFARNRDTGVLSHNFGPLNYSGGERRLNVAITRAREAVVLYTSISSSDINPGRTKSQGLLDLRDYMAAAESGLLSSSNELSLTGTRTLDLYRDAVAERLELAGLEVVVGIGPSDFKVDVSVRADSVHGWLAVILDTPQWASRRITSDRESLPEAILENVMGWSATEHVLLADWIRDPDSVVERLVNRVSNLVPRTIAERSIAWPVEQSADSYDPRPEFGLTIGIEEPPIDETTREVDETFGLHSPMSSSGQNHPALVAKLAEDSETTDAKSTQGDQSGEFSFVEASNEIIGEVNVLDQLRTRANRKLVAEQIDDVIAAEGPIERSRVAKLVGNRFGLTRVSSKRKDEILRCSSRVPEKHQTFGTFYWPDGVDAASFTGYRPGYLGDNPLSISEISHVELGNMMKSVVVDGGSMTRDELMRATMELLGMNRMGGTIKDRLTNVVEWLVQAEVLTITDDVYVAFALG